MTALIPRLRRQARLAREEYALPAATASGRVRGRPTGPRTLTFSSTAMNRGLPAACPGVSTNASGRQRRSAARWTLLVSPLRERPSAAASSRARRRRLRPVPGLIRAHAAGDHGPERDLPFSASSEADPDLAGRAEQILAPEPGR
jgi:hypothetical protein